MAPSSGKGGLSLSPPICGGGSNPGSKEASARSSGNEAENLTGGWQVVLGGIGGGVRGRPAGASEPRSKSDPLLLGPAKSRLASCSGREAAAPEQVRKMWRFMGMGLLGGSWGPPETDGDSAKTFVNPERMRLRWPGSRTPKRRRASSVRCWQSWRHLSWFCSKASVYWSRRRVCSHSARASEGPSAMAPGALSGFLANSSDHASLSLSRRRVLRIPEDSDHCGRKESSLISGQALHHQP